MSTSIVGEVKEPLVFINEELCWFVLKSPNISKHPHQNFHIILTELNGLLLQALKGFFLLLKESKCGKLEENPISVCLVLDFSKVPPGGRCVEVYKFLLNNIGPEVTELRLCGMIRPTQLDPKSIYYKSQSQLALTNGFVEMDSSHLNINPFSIASPILRPNSTLPLNLARLHTVRISNLGGAENIMWLSYFLNAAKNLKQLHLEPFEYVHNRLLLTSQNKDLSSPEMQNQNYDNVYQLRLLGQCTDFESMGEATLFVKLYSPTSHQQNSSVYIHKAIRTNWDGTPETTMGIGIPLPMKIQLINPQGENYIYRNALSKILCATPSLVALNGLTVGHEVKLSSPFHALEKLELEAGPEWLLDNLQNFPMLKLLVWIPIWSQGNPPSEKETNPVTDLRPQTKPHTLKNLEIFRIVHGWNTFKTNLIPDNAGQILEIFSASFPQLKIVSFEVSDSDSDEALMTSLLQHFPQVKEFLVTKYVGITQIEHEKAPQAINNYSGYGYQVNNEPEVSYVLEQFEAKMSSFKSKVEKQLENIYSKRDGQRPILKICAFIFDQTTALFCYEVHGFKKFEANIPEICSAILNLNLSQIVIPVKSAYEAQQILTAIKASEPRNLTHAHFQIMRLPFHSNANRYQGVPQSVIDSFEPFFLVTYDFEPGQNTLSCSPLAKDFWK